MSRNRSATRRQNPAKRDEAKTKHDDSHQHAQEGRSEEGRRQENAGRPEGKSVHIPDEKFHQQFGRQHTVVIRQTVIVEGRPRFQYGGYWFAISDPWPAE